jgi:hypothetical protein
MAWLAVSLGCGLASGAAAMAAPASATSPEARAAIEAHVAPTTPAGPRLELAAGDTRFVVHRVVLPDALRGLDPQSVEARVTGVRTPSSVVVHTRADRFVVHEGVATWVVPIHVVVGAARGGDVRYDLNLIEREGLGNSIHRRTVRTHAVVVAPVFTRVGLARDFAGYRMHRARARRFAERLKTARLGLDLRDDGHIPPTGSLGAKGVELLSSFIRHRHRMHAAARHLDQARRTAPPDLRELAAQYWKHRNAPRAELGDLPAIPLAAEPKPAAEPSSRDPNDDGVLAPITTYAPGSDRVREAPDPAPPTPDPPGATPSRSEPAAASARNATPRSPVTESFGRDDEGPDAELRREGRQPEGRAGVPAQRRGLTLDDPNIGFGGSARFTWAEARVRETATAAAVFFFAQAALTKRLGLEVTVPTQYVSLHDIEAESVYANGNPLVAAKYRLHLPAWAGRRPALTLRARLGIPWSPPSKLRPSDFLAEDLTRQVHFVDTWAFLPDYWNTGIGGSLAWELGPVSMQTQLYLDYLFPLDEDERDLVALAYGAGAGYAPVEWITGWVEGRATSLLSGFSRTELVAYAGARARLWGWFEPAVFVGLPVGSIADTSSVQLGAEVRVAWDLLDAERSSSAERPGMGAPR